MSHYGPYPKTVTFPRLGILNVTLSPQNGLQQLQIVEYCRDPTLTK